MQKFHWCGWHVRSEIPLPELTSYAGNDDSSSIEIRYGQVPRTLDGATHAGPFIQIGQDHTAIVELAKVARYLICRDTIMIEPQDDALDFEVRAMLYSTVLGLLCHMRGSLPLHASCVGVQDGAVAFAGHSGSGKSVIAAALARRGHPIIADTVTAIDTVERGAVVSESIRCVELWKDSFDVFNTSVRSFPAGRQGQRKRYYASRRTDEPQVRDLRAIFLLEGFSPDGELKVEPLSGATALSGLWRYIYLLRFGDLLGRKTDIMAMCATTIGSARIFRIQYPRNLEAIDAAVSGLMSHVAAR